MTEPPHDKWIEMKHPVTGGWIRCLEQAEPIYNASGWVRTLSTLIADGDWTEVARRAETG